LRPDVKEIVGLLMRCLGGEDIPVEEIEASSFEAEGPLHEALNRAYIELLEFAHDRGARLRDDRLDRTRHAALEDALGEIVRKAD
jgi:hypothetical protein